jgi:hypothetical protein
MGAAAWTMACVLLAANAGPTGTFYFNQRDFQIPIGIKDPGRRPDIKEVLLFLAAADGKNWQLIGRAPPEREGFPFRASEDGSYLFKMGVIDARSGKQEDGEAKCIIVDTIKPLVQIQSAERQGDDVLVRWTVTEKNPDWTTLKLEYLPSDAPTALWVPVTVSAPESGQASFRINGSAVAVHLAVVDLAKNDSGWVELPVKNAGGMGIAATGGSGGGALPPLAADPGPAPGPLPTQLPDRSWSPAPPGGTAPAVLTKTGGRTGSDSTETGTTSAQVKPTIVAAAGSEVTPPPAVAPPGPARGPLPPVQMVKKRQITIDYEVTKFGPSGVKSVELYVTRDDGRTWLLCGGEDKISGAAPAEPRGTADSSFKRSLTVELQADGLYGFYLVVRSGAGLGKPPPRNGLDAPQMRIEVDTTAPRAELYEPRPHPTRRDCLVLAWTATDNKLGPKPITWQWAERPDGEWQTIGGGEMPNTGEYVWQVPTNIPPHVYLRLLVRDLAGNESIAQPPDAVLVDLNEPEVKPLQITVPH